MGNYKGFFIPIFKNHNFERRQCVFKSLVSFPNILEHFSHFSLLARERFELFSLQDHSKPVLVGKQATLRNLHLFITMLTRAWATWVASWQTWIFNSSLPSSTCELIKRNTKVQAFHVKFYHFFIA
jgi:hypothetical protein